MTKAEIVILLRELSQRESVLDFSDEFSESLSEFFRIQAEEEHEWEIAKLERIEGGEKPEAIEKPVYEHLDEVRALSNLFKEKKKVEVKEQKDVEKKNLEKKQTYIAALKDLIQNEENIGRAIARYRDIQEGWKIVGPIPRDQRQSTQREFSNLVDTFQYNLNIFKDIKDHDLNRNLQRKQELLAKLKGLVDLKRIKDVETGLHNIQEEWNSIGGTHKSEWDKIKNDYWESVNAVYEKIRKFYQDRKEQKAANIELKKQLISTAREFCDKLPENHKGWTTTTEKIIRLQTDWKKTGFGDKEANDKVWQEFREVCNSFFTKKHEYYQSRGEEFDTVKAAKEKLIEEARKLKDSTDWKEAPKQFSVLQKKWQNAGSAGPKHENKLWKKFREPIDAFFEAKDKHFNQMEGSQVENLKNKNQIIERIENLSSAGDATKTVEELKALTLEFAAAGKVPMKDKDIIQKRYQAALDKKYKDLNLSETEKEQVTFEVRLNEIRSSGENMDFLIEREQEFIRKNIDRLNKEKNQYETNMAFFSNAKETNPLFKNVLDNLKSVGDKIDGYKARLKILRQTKTAAAKVSTEG